MDKKAPCPAIDDNLQPPPASTHQPLSTAMPSVAGRTQFIGAVPDDWAMYSDHPTDYTIGPPIGFGASSTVYSATFTSPLTTSTAPCALKVLDLDALPQSAWPLLTRETQLMSLSKHPNVLRVRGSWVDGHKLYIATRLMRKGSLCDIMKYGYADGVGEEVIKCVLKQALEGLNYLHINGFLHRDIKTANLLVDDDGTVLLGDLGVAASLSDDRDTGFHASSSSPRRAANYFSETAAAVKPAATREKTLHRGKRKSFVGTPCWMAPEVVAQKHYDEKADIWSLGITALELTMGRAPNSREPPVKVLMKTLRDAPPTVNRRGGLNEYSQAFKDIVDSCLAKDPALRPTAAQLLQTPFFKSAKRKSYLVGTLLANLPPLTERQERRPRPHPSTATATRASWDFSSTLTHVPDGASQPSSLSRTMHSSTLPEGCVFEMENDGRMCHSDAETSEDPPLPSDSEQEGSVDRSSISLSRSPSSRSMSSTGSAPLETAPHLPSAGLPVLSRSPTSSSLSSSSSAFPATPAPSGSVINDSPYASSSSLEGPKGSLRGTKVWQKLSGSGHQTKDFDDSTIKRKFGGKIGGFLAKTSSKALRS